MLNIRKAFHILVLIAGTLLITVTMLSLIYDVRFWYLKALDFPRVQVLLGLLVCLILFVAANRRWGLPSALFLAGLVASLVLQVRFIYPYTPLAGEAVKTADNPSTVGGRGFSLLVVNVWMENDQTEDFLEMVYRADPDLVMAIETNKWWIERLAPLTDRYPYRVLYPLDNTYGMALYSKLPLNNTTIKFLSHKDVPSIHTEVRLADGKSFQLHAMHPVPPKPSKYPDNVGEEEVELIKVGEMVTRSKAPTIVAGDLNDVAWSNTSRLFGAESRLGDVRIGRGLYNSFDATSQILRWPLDHIYVSGEFRVMKLERLPKFGSDHFPIYVKLALQQ